MRSNKRILSFRIIKPISAVFFTVYILYLMYLTFLDPLYGRGIVHRSINVIPLKTIIQFLTSNYSLKIIIINIAGNIAAFVPMGFLLPVVFNRIDGFYKVMLVSLAAAFSIEAAQYILRVGASDIDDIILNALGGMLGYILYRFIKAGFKIN